jgi:hypothetical protein
MYCSVPAANIQIKYYNIREFTVGHQKTGVYLNLKSGACQLQDLYFIWHIWFVTFCQVTYHIKQPIRRPSHTSIMGDTEKNVGLAAVCDNRISEIWQHKSEFCEPVPSWGVCQRNIPQTHSRHRWNLLLFQWGREFSGWDTGLQKVVSCKCCYATLFFTCSVRWVQIGIYGTFIFWEEEFPRPRYIKQILSHPCLKTSLITRKCVSFFTGSEALTPKAILYFVLKVLLASL